MIKIRIGNDITLKWKVYINDGAQNLSSFSNVKVSLLDSSGNTVSIDKVTIEENTVTIKLYGYKMLGTDTQWKLGNYSLVLYINKGEKGQAVADCQNAFALVSNTASAGGDSQDVESSSEVEVETLSLAVGVAGENGKSAYEIWLAAGNTGTEAEFLESLKAPATTLESLGITIDTSANTLTYNGKSYTLTPVSEGE